MCENKSTALSAQPEDKRSAFSSR